jgi:hypothetical protein
MITPADSFAMPKLPKELTGPREPGRTRPTPPAERGPSPESDATQGESIVMPYVAPDPNEKLRAPGGSGRSRGGRRRRKRAIEPERPATRPTSPDSPEPEAVEAADDAPSGIPESAEPVHHELSSAVSDARSNEPRDLELEPAAPREIAAMHREAAPSDEVAFEPVPPAAAPFEPEAAPIEEQRPSLRREEALEPTLANDPPPLTREAEREPVVFESRRARRRRLARAAAQANAPAPAPAPAEAPPDPAPAPPAAAVGPEAAAPASAPLQAPIEEPAFQPSGMLTVAETAKGDRRLPSGLKVQKPSWPSLDEVAPAHRPFWKRRALYIVLAALFVGGWLFGKIQTDTGTGTKSDAPRIGGLPFGAPSFRCEIKSDHAGAAIAIDGKETGEVTPAELRLAPGEHQITLSMPELGSVSASVKGEKGAKVPIEIPLSGSLKVKASGSAPITVWVDGSPRGVAPVMVDHLAPGPHQIQFTAPGLASWGQTVSLKIREHAEILAKPFSAPASGLIEVRATMADDRGVSLKGAAVWVDGKQAGFTPLVLELPGGPHSIRASYRGEEAPVQLIELPGGNQRFANFQFGTGLDRPKLTLVAGTGSLPRDRSSVASAVMPDMGLSELKEMWLHARTPEGTWRRYAMTLLQSPEGAVGVTVFPVTVLDKSGRAPFYVSALTVVGDEYFTELYNDESKGWRVRRSGAKEE